MDSNSIKSTGIPLDSLPTQSSAAPADAWTPIRKVEALKPMRHEFVTIPLSRYTQLVCDSEKLLILQKACASLKADYQLAEVLKLLLLDDVKEAEDA